MSSLEDFGEITRLDEPLAPYTWLKVGGAAQYFIQPRDAEELVRLVQCCFENKIPVRVLGGGSNLLVRDEGVRGVVLCLSNACFREINVQGTTVCAGGGALLSKLISSTVKSGLAGLESLTGIPGTVGGALHGNAGGRSGDFGQYLTSVCVLTARGERFTRTEDELSFGYRMSSIDELVILEGTFELPHEDPDEIIRRMRKLWIMKKATQPLTFQSAGCIFKNSRGLSAGALIEQAGLKETRIGGAEISDRHANFVIADQGATAADVLQLVEQVRAKVSELYGVDLELELEIW